MNLVGEDRKIVLEYKPGKESRAIRNCPRCGAFSYLHAHHIDGRKLYRVECSFKNGSKSQYLEWNACCNYVSQLLPDSREVIRLWNAEAILSAR